MQKTKLGKTGIEITRLGFGAMEIRGSRIWHGSWYGRTVTDQEAEKILNEALDLGINFIDTSYDYGLSEEYIGKFISQRRQEYFLATKCGCTLVDKGDHDETPHIWTEENILHNIDESLRRMKTDHVDLLQLHNPSPEQVEKGDLVEVLRDIKNSGKTRWIGISTTLPYIKTFIEWGVFDSFQIPYSALEREHELMITEAYQSGAGTIIRGGVGRGEPGVGLGFEESWVLWQKAGLDELLEEGESRTAFQLRFTLTHPDVSTVIVGTKNPAHLQENIRIAAKGMLKREVYEEAKKRLDQVNKQG